MYHGRSNVPYNYPWKVPVLFYTGTAAAESSVLFAELRPLLPTLEAVTADPKVVSDFLALGREL